MTQKKNENADSDSTAEVSKHLMVKNLDILKVFVWFHYELWVFKWFSSIVTKSVTSLEQSRAYQQSILRPIPDLY